MATNPYKQPGAVVTAEPAATPEPDTYTGKMVQAARRHRRAFVAARNEVIGPLANLFPSHVMPAGGRLSSLKQEGKGKPGRFVVCIHPPDPIGILCWIISAEERAEHFADIADLKDVETGKKATEGHWDHSTAAERSERLKQLRPVLAAMQAEQRQLPASAYRSAYRRKKKPAHPPAKKRATRKAVKARKKRA